MERCSKAPPQIFWVGVVPWHDFFHFFAYKGYLICPFEGLMID